MNVYFWPVHPSVTLTLTLIAVVEILPQSLGVTLPLWCVDSGSAPSQFPLGEVQLTVRHSPQRNKLIVVVHACRSEHRRRRRSFHIHSNHSNQAECVCSRNTVEQHNQLLYARLHIQIFICVFKAIEKLLKGKLSVHDSS